MSTFATTKRLSQELTVAAIPKLLVMSPARVSPPRLARHSRQATHAQQLAKSAVSLFDSLIKNVRSWVLIMKEKIRINSKLPTTTVQGSTYTAHATELICSLQLPLKEEPDPKVVDVSCKEEWKEYCTVSELRCWLNLITLSQSQSVSAV